MITTSRDRVDRKLLVGSFTFLDAQNIDRILLQPVCDNP
jgi:hypothetical protein